MKFTEFKNNVERWAEERGIYKHSTKEAQLLKGLSELGELADAIVKNDMDALKDAIGDVAVCIVNANHFAGGYDLAQKPSKRFLFRTYSHSHKVVADLCRNIGGQIDGERYVGSYDYAMMLLDEVASMHGLRFNECCEAAWLEIKDRKGRMVEGGAFVKEGEA